jgi:hypothetical protein
MNIIHDVILMLFLLPDGDTGVPFKADRHGRRLPYSDWPLNVANQNVGIQVKLLPFLSTQTSLLLSGCVPDETSALRSEEHRPEEEELPLGNPVLPTPGERRREEGEGGRGTERGERGGGGDGEREGGERGERREREREREQGGQRGRLMDGWMNR